MEASLVRLEFALIGLRRGKLARHLEVQLDALWLSLWYHGNIGGSDGGRKQMQRQQGSRVFNATPWSAGAAD